MAVSEKAGLGKSLKTSGRRLSESSATREGKPHVRFEVAGNGNQDTKSQAPFPDPTTRLVGVAAFLSRFLAWSWLRPPAGNASR